jgi:hypothetical protein
VDKKVFFLAFSLNETKSFSLVEPFYGAIFHIEIPLKNTMYKPCNCAYKAKNMQKLGVIARNDRI